MENNDYLSRALNRIIRIDTVLDHRIGEIYNNESLIMTNESIKANCSVRLYQTRNYDSGISSLMFQDSDGAFYPLELRLTETYNEMDYEMMDSRASNAIRNFLKSDANAPALVKNEVVSIVRNATKESNVLFRNSTTGGYERLAYKYKRIMNASSSYSLLPIIARLDLYSSLVSLDSRFAGINIEEAMLIRREEHEAALEEENHERMTLFLTECVLDGITRAADQLFEMKHLSEYAVIFLSMKMEKGRAYTFEELALLFSLDKDMIKNLFVIPALSSDRISIGSGSDGDTVTLIG